MRLVSPTRVLHLLDAHAERGEPALQRIAKIYGLDAVDVGNLRQLLGWVGVGEKRKPRGKSGGFELFSEDTRVLKHDERSELVLLAGTVNHIYETVVVPHPHMDFAERSLKNLLNKSKPHVNGWKKLTKEQVAQLVVPQVLLLEDGASLVGLVRASSLALHRIGPAIQGLNEITLQSAILAPGCLGLRAHVAHVWRAQVAALWGRRWWALL